MKKTLALVAIMIALCSLAGPAQAGEAPTAAPLLVLGRAPAGASEAAGREAATQDALRQAVARAALEMLDQPLLRGKLEALEREVLAKPSRFVSNYSLQGNQRGPEAALALVAVSVDRPALEKALTAAGLRQTALNLPLVLALVSEEAGPGRPPAFWWGEAGAQVALPRPLVRAVAGSGLNLLEPKALAGKIPIELRQALLNEEQALTLARQSGAGLVVLGRLRTYPLVTPAGQEAPPLAQLEALEVASGQVLATEEAAGPSFSATPGPEAAEKVAQAAEEALRRLLQQAATNLKPAEAPVEQTVTLELEGLRSLADLHRFEQVLRGLSGLVAQAQREAVGGGGKASLRLKLKAPAAKLADQLMLQNYGDFLVNVLEASPQKIRLAVVGR